jgi:hypothetical protein
VVSLDDSVELVGGGLWVGEGLCVKPRLRFREAASESFKPVVASLHGS